MKKNKLYKNITIIITLLISFFCFNNDVFAASKEKINLGDNDYELKCVYSDGGTLTISKYGVYFSNLSSEVSSNSRKNFSLLLQSKQTNEYDTDGKLTKSNHDQLLDSSYGCPTKLYAYYHKQIIENEEEEEEEEIYTYFYLIKAPMGTNAGTGKYEVMVYIDDDYLPSLRQHEKPYIRRNQSYAQDVKLVSEEVYLLTDKNAIICDYETVKDENSLAAQPMSIYLYDNVTLLDFNGRVTPIGRLQTCPQKLTEDEIKNNNPNKKYLYLNDPSPQIIADNGISTNYYYNSIRYMYSTSNNDDCKKNNDGKECLQFYFIGSRNEVPESSADPALCELVGNRTIMLLADIVKWLQILVPALVIVLIGIDITKMVLSGDLTEELPKKKKTIIIRLVIMVTFFFLPLIASLIIRLINDTGIVKIGDLECFFNKLK